MVVFWDAADGNREKVCWTQFLTKDSFDLHGILGRDSLESRVILNQMALVLLRCNHRLVGYSISLQVNEAW